MLERARGMAKAARLGGKHEYWMGVWMERFVRHFEDADLKRLGALEVFAFFEDQQRQGRTDWQVKQGMEAAVFLLERVLGRDEVKWDRVWSAWERRKAKKKVVEAPVVTEGASVARTEPEASTVPGVARLRTVSALAQLWCRTSGGRIMSFA